MALKQATTSSLYIFPNSDFSQHRCTHIELQQYKLHSVKMKSRESSVGIALGYGLDD
jgi:hypothetical protein